MHTRLEPKLITVLREGYSWRLTKPVTRLTSRLR